MVALQHLNVEPLPLVSAPKDGDVRKKVMLRQWRKAKIN